jgi:hypothetical protein
MIWVKNTSIQRHREKMPLTLRGYIFLCAWYSDTSTGSAPGGGSIGSVETARGMIFLTWGLESDTWDF